jgi:hypothetical protein
MTVEVGVRQCENTFLERDEIRSNGDREGTALPLPLAGEGWVGVLPRFSLFVWREFPPPASHHSMRHSRSFASAFSSKNGREGGLCSPASGRGAAVRGQANSTKNHPALQLRLVARLDFGLGLRLAQLRLLVNHFGDAGEYRAFDLRI